MRCILKIRLRDILQEVPVPLVPGNSIIGAKNEKERRMFHQISRPSLRGIAARVLEHNHGRSGKKWAHADVTRARFEKVLFVKL